MAFIVLVLVLVLVGAAFAVPISSPSQTSSVLTPQWETTNSILLNQFGLVMSHDSASGDLP
jgi:hypothetical protein